jgi:hypothetical protein
MPRATDSAPDTSRQASAWSLGFRFSPTVEPPQAGAAAGAPVTFSGVAYSGGLIPDYGWLGNVAINLATLRNPGARVPVLVDHDISIEGIAGRCTLELRTAANGEQALHVSGVLTRATESGQTMEALFAEGYPIQMSLGLAAALREVPPEEAEQRINGRILHVQHVFENALVREVSFTPTGADPATGAAAEGQVTRDAPDTTTDPAFSFSAAPPASFIPPKQGPSTGAEMARSPEDQALLDQQAATIAQLQAGLKAAQQATRKTAFAALCTELGRELPAEDKQAPYLEMSDAAFSAYAADQRELAAKLGQGQGRRGGADPALFSAQSHQAGQRKPGADGNGAALLSAVKSLART